ncbi:MAG: winged helix-turn-helix transcriptional regulator [Anaerolineales bacterium]|nr:winged helix-turn-helix transcriptional regulator [Anaerolineales bacterium]
MKKSTQRITSVAFAKIMADPTRQQIMDACCCAWRSVSEIVTLVQVSQPTVSHHLSVLREAGLVEIKEQGKHSYYTLNQEAVAQCCGQLLSTFAPESRAASQLSELTS